jgi:hypothetical protein
MNKKSTKIKKASGKSPKKVRTAKKAAPKKKSVATIGKTTNALSTAKSASLKKTIRRIKTGLKQLEKTVGK